VKAAAERLRQEAETFDLQKAHADRWFAWRLAAAWVALVTYKGDPAKLADFLAREVPGYLMTIDPDAPVLELETGAPDAGRTPDDSSIGDPDGGD
jgi:hypothetical protein